MASNQTPNYGLSQWSLDDSVVMADFNADNLKLEEALNTITASIPQIRTGTYTGTGLSGPDNPNVLEFDFKPVFIAIIEEEETPKYANTIRGIAPWLFVRPWKHTNKFYNGNTDANSYFNYVTWLDNGVSWYAQYDNGSTADPSGQLNESNVIYHYVAMG